MVDTAAVGTMIFIRYMVDVDIVQWNDYGGLVLSPEWKENISVLILVAIKVASGGRGRGD